MGNSSSTPTGLCDTVLTEKATDLLTSSSVIPYLLISKCREILVIAFSDVEGVRFQSTFIGSAAIAGILPVSALQITDKSGVTSQDALKKNSIEVTEEHLQQLRYDPKSVWGYVKIHIEQGPVLEWVGFPLGVVKGIAGQTRLKVTMRGSQGHAGTVPMSMRHDPMAAAAEAIVLLESLLQVTFTVDLRAIDDMGREAVVCELSPIVSNM
ncbi:hypothetical protein ABKV19_026902 [Rosa sericea]